MLGEAARTMADAERYRAAYQRAIAAIGREARGKPIEAAPGLSVKLAAFHPRYETTPQGRVMGELLPSLLGLAVAAAFLLVPSEQTADHIFQIEGLRHAVVTPGCQQTPVRNFVT